MSIIIVNDFPKNAEYWRTVDGFPAYEVSTDGRVRTIKTGLIRKLQVGNKGYLYVGLKKDKKDSKHYVHILVATAFCNKTDSNNIVDHIDHNRVNNNFENLRWTNHSGNNRNLSISSRNRSGTQGFFFEKSRGRWVASWYDDNMKQQIKYFSVKKLGDEQAKQLAINYRKQMAEENGYLNV